MACGQKNQLLNCGDPGVRDHKDGVLWCRVSLTSIENHPDLPLFSPAGPMGIPCHLFTPFQASTGLGPVESLDPLPRPFWTLHWARAPRPTVRALGWLRSGAYFGPAVGLAQGVVWALGAKGLTSPDWC